MKFTEGYWRLREQFTAAHPVEVLDVATTPETFEVYALTEPMRHRGDLLKGPVVTITCSTPMPDVVGVRITHFAGESPKSPSFELARSATEPQVVVAGDGAELTSGALSVRVERASGWEVSFAADGRALTRSAAKAIAIMEGAGGRHFVREQLTLGVGDLVYGLGERFGPLVRNGQAVDIWNEDGGTASELAYKNVPFLITNAGYGVFVDHPGNVSFEVASESVSRLQFSVEGQALEYFVIYGPSPKEILRKYTALTGRSALPPAWSFGLWLSTSFTTSYDEATVTGFIEGMAQRELPLSVFHFDCFWMREINWCDFEWDPRVFPDPAGLIQRLRARGLEICLWINPYIAQRSPLFAEGQAAGYLLRRPNGDVWQWDQWQPGMALVDFTNPAARDWYASKLDTLLELGVACFKTDFGERIPTDVAYFDGSDPERMHNYYTYLYNRTVFEALGKRRGEGQAVVFARSATVGGQRFPVHWSGDTESSYEAMAESLRGGLSLGMSGFGYWSHDIGGFEGTPSPALFKRWIALGLLSSHSRLHGSGSYRVPWLFDEESVDVLRAFTKLKLRLMPYLYGAARQAQQHGWPMMRAMVVEFPDDPACSHLERQYLLGDSLLVAPVLSDGPKVTYYLPAGTWTHFLTGVQVSGPGWVTERHGFDSVPLLVRPGSVIPVGPVADRPDYDYTDGLTLRVYQLTDGDRVTTEIPGPGGQTAASFSTRRDGDRVRVEASGSAAGWRVLLVGVGGEPGAGAVAEPHEQGLLVTPAAGASALTVIVWPLTSAAVGVAGVTPT